MLAKLSRRGMLRLAAVMPVAAQGLATSVSFGAAGTAAAAAGAAKLADEAMKLTGSVVGECAPSTYHGASEARKLLGLKKLGLLPDWFINQRRRHHAEYNRIPPDVAALRSVSLSAKHRISADRLMDSYLDEMERSLVDDLAREKFYDLLRMEQESDQRRPAQPITSY